MQQQILTLEMLKNPSLRLEGDFMFTGNIPAHSKRVIYGKLTVEGNIGHDSVLEIHGNLHTHDVGARCNIKARIIELDDIGERAKVKASSAMLVHGKIGEKAEVTSEKDLATYGAVAKNAVVKCLGRRTTYEHEMGDGKSSVTHASRKNVQPKARETSYAALIRKRQDNVFNSMLKDAEMTFSEELRECHIPRALVTRDLQHKFDQKFSLGSVYEKSSSTVVSQQYGLQDVYVIRWDAARSGEQVRQDLTSCFNDRQQGRA